MGSTGDEHDKGIDFRVGGLVWVRRRNGSWWPGKILSPDELPDGCAAIPRSGTPVKLLGKKGKSVDWYNLEKSKRVKAFHCGEYEDCIEKAKVSASHISKKGVRKARREDAILHALEIESALRLKDNSTPNQGNGKGPVHVHDSTSGFHPSEVIENGDLRNSKRSDINHRASNIDSSIEEQEVSKDEPAKWNTPNDSEEDAVCVKRMRGLEDLGVGVPPSLKRKRSQVAYESLKKKNRHRPLTKVLECSTMLSSPFDQFPCANGISNGVAVDQKVSGFEANESINSISIEIKNEVEFLCSNGTRAASMEQHQWKDGDNESSENLFDVPLISESIPTEASQRAPFGDRTHSSQSTLVGTPSSSSPCRSSLAMEKATSDWQTKGKRNSRARKSDTDDEHLCSLNEKEPKVENPNGSTPELVSSQESLPHCLSNVDSSDFSLRRHFSDSCLCDIAVMVEVKSNDRLHHVPFVSLISKMNNLPVTGHPLKTEVLDEAMPIDSKSPISRSKSYKSRKLGMFSKKTRKLSSLTSTHGSSRKAVVKNLKSPIACIPLKVVFSRINSSLSSQPRSVVETNGR